MLAIITISVAMIRALSAIAAEKATSVMMIIKLKTDNFPADSIVINDDYIQIHLITHT